MKKILMFTVLFAIALAPANAFGASKLVWDASERADGYYIKYWVTADPSKAWSEDVGNVLEVPCADLNLEYGVDFTFECYAYNSVGESGPSDQINFVEGVVERPPEKPPLVGTPPGIPTGLSMIGI